MDRYERGAKRDRSAFACERLPGRLVTARHLRIAALREQNVPYHRIGTEMNISTECVRYHWYKAINLLRRESGLHGITYKQMRASAKPAEERLPESCRPEIWPSSALAR